MPSAYTPSLKLILQATGENSGNWGNLTNTDFTSLIELAVAGYESISMVDADRTLTNGDGSTANEARYAFINMVSSVALTVARNVIVPTASKLYFFKNATTGGQALTVKTTAGTGISVPNGKVMVLMCDGTNVIDAVTSFSSLTLATALPVTSGGTGVTTSTGSGNTVLSTSPTLVTPALGTPSALVGTNITGTATAFTASNVTTNANLTGAVTSVGNAASLGSFTSAQLATALTDETGTGANVFATSPTLVTPALGTPSALVGTNITGTATAFTASNVTTNANLTGAVTSVGNAASLGSFTSAQLATALTDETGTGANVFATSPTLVTPALGTPSALVGTNITGTAAGLNIGGNAATATTATTVTTNANLTGAVTSVGNTASLGSFTSAQLATALTDETGTGANVFATSPTLVTPALGTPSAIVLTNATSVPVNQATGTLPVANGGTGTTTSTGTGSNVLSISPTFTGTVGVAALNTTGKLGVGTATPAGIFSVVSTTSTGTSTSSWSNAYSTFGPNAGSTSGAALGLGYNTTTDRSEVLSLAAGTAWKPMTVYTAGVQFAAQAGTEAMRVVSNDAAAGVVSMALRLSCNSTTDTNAIVAMGLGVQNDGFSKGGIGWVRSAVGSDVGSLAFYNNGTNDSSNISTADEAMQIDSSKNLLVGTTTTVASAKVVVSSTTQGFLPPVMTTAQKNAISSPTAGLIIFDTTLAKLCVYSGSAWQTITSV